ncbi:hypothetical protein JCGZ_26966 [Jatropha curcas]|uniref:Uncharacterized protein n=1 Tax=Jatropha curcas TaxID=180498 RepID=A0A067L3Y1_JATCU|nr:rho GTPase-activating protein gacJ [Jatropha curcas]KDP41948.1 hypothetical protein JCGZ_26966 [Jatropha curcas]
MSSLFLVASAFAIHFALLSTCAQARPLPDLSLLKATILANYGRNQSPPPPSPVPSPRSQELTTIYQKPLPSPPPPPKPASPNVQLEIIASPACSEGDSIPCNNKYIYMVMTADSNYGRTTTPPKLASPLLE